MDKQRIYDAMLIKGFRKDVTTGMVNYWLTPYGIHTPDPELKRQPPANNMRVQSFVGIYLKPLADRLWDTTKDQDIKTLDWMVHLDSQKTDRIAHAERVKGDRDARIQRTRHALTREGLSATNPNNQWGVTKATVRLRRVKLK